MSQIRYSIKKQIYYLNVNSKTLSFRNLNELKLALLTRPELSRSLVAFALNRGTLSSARGQAKRQGGYAWLPLNPKKKKGPKINDNNLVEKIAICYHNKRAALKYHSFELFYEAELELCRLQGRKFSKEQTKIEFEEMRLI